MMLDLHSFPEKRAWALDKALHFSRTPRSLENEKEKCRFGDEMNSNRQAVEQWFVCVCQSIPI